MEYGIQVSSFKPLLTSALEVDTVFSRIRDMGCEVVQLQWISREVLVSDTAAALKASGLRSVSVQEFYQVFLESKEYFLDLAQQTGSTWICVSRIPERCKSAAGLSALVAEWRELMTELDGHGMKLCFHPTSPDYQEIEGVQPIVYLMEQLPELELCLDLYHCHKCGLDMSSLIRRYAGRIPMVHFKDYRRVPQMVSDTKAGTTTEILVPAGSGDIDWTGVREACLETGVLYAFAEQETWQGDPFEALEQGFRWMASPGVRHQR